jgi:hypothetical protein
VDDNHQVINPPTSSMLQKRSRYHDQSSSRNVSQELISQIRRKHVHQPKITPQFHQSSIGRQPKPILAVLGHLQLYSAGIVFGSHKMFLAGDGKTETRPEKQRSAPKVDEDGEDPWRCYETMLLVVFCLPALQYPYMPILPRPKHSS